MKLAYRIVVSISLLLLIASSVFIGYKVIGRHDHPTPESRISAADQERVKKLISKLKEESKFPKPTSVQLLAEAGDELAILALEQALEDESRYIRFRAATALAHIGDKAGIPVLLEELKGDYGLMQHSALAALTKIGDRSVVPTLIDVLKRENLNYFVRENTAEALGNIGDRSATSVLKDTMMKALQDHGEYVQNNAAEALGKMEDTSKVPIVMEMLKDRDARVRWNAAVALKGMTGRNFGDDYVAWKDWRNSSR